MNAHRLQGDGQQAGRHLLARGDHRVIFASIENLQIGAGGLRRVLHPAHEFVRLA